MFLSCVPKAACVGGQDNACAKGYHGRACSECVREESQRYFRLGQECHGTILLLFFFSIRLFFFSILNFFFCLPIPLFFNASTECPNNAQWYLVILGLIGLVVSLLFLKVASSGAISVKAVSIGFNLFQGKKNTAIR